MTVRWLSFPLSPTTQAYGGGEGLSIATLTSISKGDTANTLRMAFPGHLGTHVDLPRHFFEGGPSLTDYGPAFWIFRSAQIVDTIAHADALVRPEHLATPLRSDTDLLLVRTGHQSTRGTEAYWAAGPGLSAELGRWLRAAHPSVRAVGMDTISVTSRLHRTAGREAHRALLDPHGTGAPIVAIEDMDLAGLTDQRIGTVLVSPLQISDADGVPVTVWAFSI